MAPHSSTLAWKVPWTEEPGGLQSMGSLRVRHDWATSLSLFTLMHWRRKWQPTPVFLPGESQGWWSLVGCRLWGCPTVGHDRSDLAAWIYLERWIVFYVSFIWFINCQEYSWLSSMKEVEFSPFNTSQFPTLSCNFDYFITYYIAYKNIFKLFSWSINYVVKPDSLLGKMRKLVCLHFS